MAMLPLSDYERLVALAADPVDLLLYDKAKRSRDARGEEAVPAAFAKRLIRGENALKVWREYRGMSQKDLATVAGLSGAFLSQIENGARRGRIGAIVKIANALGVTVDDLVPPEERADNSLVPALSSSRG
jgi:DNA-binding XRE family transcriptional regulator